MGFKIGDIFKYKNGFLIVQIVGGEGFQTACGKYINGVYEGVVYMNPNKIYELPFITNIMDLDCD